MNKCTYQKKKREVNTKSNILESIHYEGEYDQQAKETAFCLEKHQFLIKRKNSIVLPNI